MQFVQGYLVPFKDPSSQYACKIVPLPIVITSGLGFSHSRISPESSPVLSVSSVESTVESSVVPSVASSVVSVFSVASLVVAKMVLL